MGTPCLNVQGDFDPKNQYLQNTYGYNLPDGQVMLTFDAVNALIQGYTNALLHKNHYYWAVPHGRDRADASG